MDKATVDEFLRELAELTKKHGIHIVSCGCCASPRLETVGGNAVVGECLEYDAEKGVYTA